MADIRVRVGQQNAVKVISSATGTPVGIAGYANYSGISSYSNYSGIATYSNYSGISSYSNYSGIATYSNYSGIATYSNYSGIATYSNYSGIATYSNYSGIATYAYNIYGGSANRLVYQTAPGVTSFVSAGSFGQILYTDINGTPIWINSPPLDAITGLTVINQNEIVGGANSITTLRIVGFGLSASLGVTSSVANLEIIEIDGGEY